MSKNSFSLLYIKGIFGCILFVVFFTLFPTESYAASFYHEHNDSCYTDVTKTCTDDVIDVGTGENTFHCSNCIAMRKCNMLMYTHKCPYKRVDDSSTAYVITCATCGYTVRGDSVPQNKRVHSYTEREMICTKATETPIASVSLSLLNDNPTNGSVTISCGVSIADAEFALAAAPYNFGAGNTDKNTFEVTENGTYAVSVCDSRGKTVSASISVNNIDKTAPVIEKVTKDTEAWSEKGVTVTVQASDAGGGLSDAAYSFNNGEYTASNSFCVKKNGSLLIKVRDKAGNVSETSINITNVGKDPAVVAAEKAAAERAAAEKAAAEKAAAEQKALAEKQAAEKLEAEKKAAEKLAAQQKASQQKKEAESKKTEAEKTNTASTESEITADNSGEDEYIRMSEIEETVNRLLDERSDNGSLSNQENGELILVKDMVDSFEPEDDYAGEDASPAPESFSTLPEEPASSAELRIVKASAGEITLLAGILLAVGGAIIISFFSYIYIVSNGKKKLICLCRVQKSEEATVLIVPQGKLKASQRYLIYLSPWKRIGRKNMPIRIMTENDENIITADEGITFRF